MSQTLVGRGLRGDLSHIQVILGAVDADVIGRPALQMT